MSKYDLLRQDRFDANAFEASVEEMIAAGPYPLWQRMADLKNFGLSITLGEHRVDPRDFYTGPFATD